MANAIKLQPGFLVGLSTKIEGGVHYTTRDLNAPEGVVTPVDGAQVNKWETTKVTNDPEEHARAVKARGKARALIEGTCIRSPFGLLCPTARIPELDQAIRDSDAMIDAFNEGAVHTRIGAWCIRGQIVESDSAAAQAISMEIADILADMQKGITDRDAEAIRESARKARALGGMLDETAAAAVTKSVERARAAAREIIKTIKERGDANLILVADSYINEIATARAAFLDFGTDAADSGDGEGSLPPVLPKGLDTDDADDVDFGDGDDMDAGGSAPDLGLGDVDASDAVDADIMQEAEARAQESGDAREIDL